MSRGEWDDRWTCEVFCDGSMVLIDLECLRWLAATESHYFLALRHAGMEELVRQHTAQVQFQLHAGFVMMALSSPTRRHDRDSPSTQVELHVYQQFPFYYLPPNCQNLFCGGGEAIGRSLFTAC